MAILCLEVTFFCDWKCKKMIDVLWAKKDGKHWLSLKSHLLDTAETMDYLWNNWVSQDLRDRLCNAFRQNLSVDECGRFLRFLALAHDVGKATPIFQSKILQGKNDADAVILKRFIKKEIPLKEHFLRDLYHAQAGYNLLIEAGCNLNAASIVGSHHGMPSQKQPSNDNQEAYYLESEGKCVWSKLQKDILSWVLQQSGYASFESVPVPAFNSQVWMTGLLIMADWIASNRAFFPMIAVDSLVTGNNTHRLNSSDLVFLRGGFFESMRQSNLALPEVFRHRFSFYPNTVQLETCGIANSMSDSGIIVLEAQMGKGKTEAALAAGEILASKFDKKGLFFALPSQATSDGMFVRVKEFLESENYKGSINLVHAKAAYNREYNEIPHINSVWDEQDDLSLGIGEWFEGKKQSLLSNFVVGTVDQLLMAGLQQKHVMLRHLGLADKIVIVDEVHAYDAYMSVYLKKALSWLGAYHVPVILLSATLPHKKKMELITAYVGKERSKNIEIPPYSGEYPVLTYYDDLKIQSKPIANTDLTRSVDVDYSSSDIIGLAEIIEKTLDRSDGCVGVILNTVKNAQKLYMMLKKQFSDDEIILIHSGFLANDRVAIEEKIRKTLGRSGMATRPQKFIVIGTQVLEQSLDIDFDWLITEQCPIDLLLQRIGRLHRHGRERPEIFSQAKCLVVMLSDQERDASELIYGRYLLRRTRAVIEAKSMRIRIPDDLSQLVEDVYDCEDLSDADYSNWVRSIQNKDYEAKQFCIADPVDRFDRKFLRNMDYLLDNRKLCVTTEGEARVRDTNGSIEVVIFQMKHGRIYHVSGDKEVCSDKELACETVRLPYSLSGPHMIQETVKALENLRNDTLSDDLRNSVWLKDTLFLAFNENQKTKLEVGKKVYSIKYDNMTGIHVEKEENT